MTAGWNAPPTQETSLWVTYMGCLNKAEQSIEDAAVVPMLSLTPEITRLSVR